MFSLALIVASVASTIGAHPLSPSDSYSTVETAAPACDSSSAPVGFPSAAGFKNATYRYSISGAASCVEGFLKIDAKTAMNSKLNFTNPASEIVVVQNLLDMFTPGLNYAANVNLGNQAAAGSFDIKATYCTPKNNLSPRKVQLLTHGLGFDKSYWDFAPGYSYVDAATERGDAALFYDRLGVGPSSKADPIQTIQTLLEIEIAHTLASMLRAGTISNSKFSEVVGVGHSFGSIITTGVSARYPTAFNATILTGFSINSDGMPGFNLGNNYAIANQNDPARFGDLSNGFVVISDIISNQNAFFHAPGFDPAILAAANAARQTITFGEFFTNQASIIPSTTYTRPVAVVNGQEDLPFCNGNCTYPSNVASNVKTKLYPNVSSADFDYYFAQNTGHGINLHYSATAAYRWIQEFLSKHNL